MKLGEYIKQYRDEHGLSMREFARRADMSVQHVSNIEKGINNMGKPLSPTMDSYAKVAKATGRSLADLLMELNAVVEINGEMSDTDRAFLTLYKKAPPAVRDAVRVLLAPYDDSPEDDTYGR